MKWKKVTQTSISYPFVTRQNHKDLDKFLLRDLKDSKKGTRSLPETALGNHLQLSGIDVSEFHSSEDDGREKLWADPSLAQPASGMVTLGRQSSG